MLTLPQLPQTWRGLVAGLLSLAAFTAIKLVFLEQIGQPTPFLLYFGAVFCSAWHGGIVAGGSTAFLGSLLANILFIPPLFQLSFSSVAAVAQTALYLCEGILISVMTARLRAERSVSAGTYAEARSALAQLTAVLEGVDDGVSMQEASSGRIVYANEAAARLCGFESAQAMTRSTVGQIMERFELLQEDRTPFPVEQLPSRILAAGKTPKERLILFRIRPTGEERWAIVRGNPVCDAQGQMRFVVNVYRDITEQRRQEERLRISREWFATALRSIGDAVITTDRESRITFLNPVAEQLTGWKTEEASGRPLHEVFRIVHETTRAPVESPVERVLREGVVVGLANHTTLLQREGGEIAIDDSAAPIKTDSGDLVGVVLVFRNVSVERHRDARKGFLMRATAELNSSLDYEATLATVARLAVPDIADWCAVDMVEGRGVKRLAVAHIDPKKIELVNEIERRYPPDPNAATGTPNVLRTGRPEMMAEIPDLILETVARDEEHLRLIRSLGLRSYIAVPIRHGDTVRGVLSLVMAESRRTYEHEDMVFASTLAERAAIAIENALLFREAQQLRIEAATQRDRLKALILAAPIGICVLRGPDLVIELMNERHRARLGAAARVGTPISELNVDPANTAMLRRVFETGEAASGVEKPATADYAGGRQTRYVTYFVQPLRDADGKVDQIVLFVEDVTDQVEARKRLESARAEAERASRTKDEFLAMLGHELRNPLAPIVTALQLIQMQPEDAFKREHTIIERQVKHMTRMVDDLLDIARITRGKVELSRRPVELSEAVAKALEMAGPLIEQRRHEVTVAVPGGLVVNADPVRLAQVVANLLNNAAKYTDKGGHISIRGEREGEQAVLAVGDNGIGIGPETLPQIFEIFTQESQALDRAQGGLGLGLAIVRSLVTLHGGTVEARSEGSGRGSEFIVRLPAAAASLPEHPAEPRAVDQVKRAARERLLVVDDNTDALELLCESLEQLGYETLRASDGPSALALAAKAPFRLGILDIGLPVMDGYELARRLRQLSGLAEIKLIALTGYGQPSDRERSAEAGFDEHLVKPVSLGAVQKALERLIAPSETQK